jgi:hypothetical protein
VSRLIVKAMLKGSHLEPPEAYAAILVYADQNHVYVHQPRRDPADAPEVVHIDLRTHRVLISSTAERGD